MWKTATKGVLLVAALAVVAVAVVRLNQPGLPSGPVPIVWDKEVCAHCKMHVGDPRFAAQVQTVTGEVLSFDDPGCLFDYLSSHELEHHEIYFRDYLHDGWLAASEVGFIAVDESPMGYGLAAVPDVEEGARDLRWAREQVAARPHHGGEGE